MRYAPAAALILAAATTALAAPPFTMTILVREGDLTEIGAITSVDNVMVNNSGHWLVECDTNNANTAADGIIIRGGAIAYQQGTILPPPANGVIGISSFDDLVLNNNGDSGWNWFLSGATTSTDSGIFFNDRLLIQEGTHSTATGFSPSTPYIGWFGCKMNDANQILMVASVDDPALASTVDRALVRVDYNSSTQTFTETVLAKEGEAVGASTIADFSTDAAAFAWNQSGTPMYCAELVASTTDALFVGSTIVAQELQPSPIAGRTWEILNDRPLDLNNSGAWVVRGNLTGDTIDDEVIVKGDGTVVAREGQAVPAALGPWAFTGFGSAPVQMDDSGNVVWYGDWNDPSTNVDNGLFWNGDLLIQDGVTVVDGQTVTTVRGIADGFAMSDNGRYLIVRVVLGTSTDAAVLISFCPGNQCGPQDFNGDGDAGTDQDIEAFFACLGGNCCPTCFCQGSDFNGDGDIGTDQDIEAFFRVLGGSPC
ncbi:MAG TPA: hypothetical protein VD997_08585 [Phycisphaerales bacterium]|nr:hypothetical protein [Phycisphaerales bacterium]